jgi:hypothetical protein
LQKIFTLCYIKLHEVRDEEQPMITRGYTTEEGDRLNNFAIEPKVHVEETQRAGFTEYAEKLNGRLAMIGFVSALVLEVFTGHGVIGWLTSL